MRRTDCGNKERDSMTCEQIQKEKLRKQKERDNMTCEQTQKKGKEKLRKQKDRAMQFKNRVAFATKFMVRFHHNIGNAINPATQETHRNGQLYYIDTAVATELRMTHKQKRS
ncbi:hypothetical protein L596_024599 [Steinernema carpocapsae]|uniref:Uncharacterized protein n=1 Tax=Steinernema carpocapsae TaxID=34508 RepID=A0A4U5MH96_STECR|nr:hypothetical protein L596_024599 [Steinernema carpocapsae]